MFSRVRHRDMVVRLHIIGQGEIAMCKALRDVQHSRSVGRQLDSGPPTEERGALAQVDDHIEQRAACALDDFYFGEWLALKMHPSKRAPGLVPRKIALRERWIQTAAFEFIWGPCPRKIATLVLDRLGVDDEGARQ